MINAEELSVNANLEWENEKDINEQLAQIFEIKGRIEARPVNEWSMDSLVDHVFTLAKIMDNLSDLKDYAILVAEATEEEYDSAVRDRYIELKEGGDKITDAMAKAKAEQGCENIKERELKARYNSRLLTDLYKDCERLISFSQTKVKSLVDNSIRTNISTN